jgi:predicted ATPase
LALKAATQVIADYANGVFVVELAALMRADLVGHIVASSIGITESHTDSVSDAVVEELRSKSILLVLDNCEHVIEACAEIVHTLIRACPRLRILATSREPLGVQGETTWAVPPLAMAAPDAPLEAQTGSDAARLFVERVNAVRSDFVLDERNTQVVLDICRAMAGIPLALELAAARLRVMEPEEVQARLGQALSLLAGSSRTAPPRQRTMRAALDWSYALLSENEQQLLADLSVFAGGWDLEAVEATCAVQPLAALEALDVMTSLVDKSLIMVERHDGHSRYRFLEPVRQYAHERLDARGDIQAIRRRHALHYLQVAEDAALEMVSHHLTARLDRLEREHDNFRAALEWSTQHGDGETGLRLAAALRWFWLVRGYASEGRAWLRRAFATENTATPIARARALVAAGSLAMFQHDHSR